MVAPMKESHCGLLPLTNIRTLRKNSGDPVQMKQLPLTPCDILFKPEKKPPLVTGVSSPAREASIIGRKCDDTAVPSSFSRRASMADVLPLELPLGDSDDYLCPPAPYTTMDKLVGVFMYVKCCPLLAPSLTNLLTLPGIILDPTTLQKNLYRCRSWSLWEPFLVASVMLSSLSRQTS